MLLKKQNKINERNIKSQPQKAFIEKLRQKRTDKETEIQIIWARLPVSKESDQSPA